MKTNRLFQSLISAVGLLLVSAMLAAPDDSLGRAKDCRLRIAGRVTRSSNRGPVPERRVQVHLLTETGKLLCTARTDNDGYYAFDEVCPGTYTVRPGPLWLANVEGPRLPPLYTPSSSSVTLPAPISSIISPRNIDFVRNEPPPPGEPREDREEDEIRIDESTRAGRDMELALRVKQFLEKTLPCKGPRRCDLAIKVSSGEVELSGIVGLQDRPLLEKVREKVQGVRLLNLDKIESGAKP